MRREYYRRPEDRAAPRRKLGWWGALSAFTAALTLLLVLLYVPASTSAATAAAPELGRRFFQEAHNRLGESLREYAYVKKVYRIPTGSLPARPAEDRFGATRDPAVILALLEQAEELLEGEGAVAWSPETVLAPDSYIQYYYDETILVLTWQELSEDRICTWCEVKVADPTQFRRKLAGDTYGWPIQAAASDLAVQDNAVAAVSGDFYAFRNCGVHVYQGALRNVFGQADTLFVTAEGDLRMVRQGQIQTWEQARRYMAENNVAFSVAFGPILVENGVNVTPSGYPWGEIWDEYARAAISQVGHLHYLFLAANCNVWGGHRFTALEAAELMLNHGCDMAYALDGGQTAEVVLGGSLVNRPEFGYERQVSDVLCFASALPEGGGA